MCTPNILPNGIAPVYFLRRRPPVVFVDKPDRIRIDNDTALIQVLDFHVVAIEIVANMLAKCVLALLPKSIQRMFLEMQFKIHSQVVLFVKDPGSAARMFDGPFARNRQLHGWRPSSILGMKAGH
jgi:hypothetical protein